MPKIVTTFEELVVSARGQVKATVTTAQVQLVLLQHISAYITWMNCAIVMSISAHIFYFASTEFSCCGLNRGWPKMSLQRLKRGWVSSSSRESRVLGSDSTTASFHFLNFIIVTKILVMSLQMDS